ncbi:MAG: signal peptidase II [Alphaproteobacteria bacterium]|nr:signal peptidase II [Alphaproteobacteria bacterium]
MALRVWGPLSPLVLAIAALVFGLDQTHKWWMLQVYDIAARQPVRVTPFFDLVLAWNKGVSYGLFSSHEQLGLIALSGAITAALWIWACRSASRLTAFALAILIGGALGNAIDRAVHGAVADFFHFHWGSFSWYVFNIADMAIVAGVGLLLYESIFHSETGRRRGNA